VDDLVEARRVAVVAWVEPRHRTRLVVEAALGGGAGAARRRVAEGACPLLLRARDRRQARSRTRPRHLLVIRGLLEMAVDITGVEAQARPDRLGGTAHENGNHQYKASHAAL